MHTHICLGQGCPKGRSIDLPVDHKGFAGRSHDIPLKIYNQNDKGKYL